MLDNHFSDTDIVDSNLYAFFNLIFEIDNRIDNKKNDSEKL